MAAETAANLGDQTWNFVKENPWEAAGIGAGAVAVGAVIAAPSAAAATAAVATATHYATRFAIGAAANAGKYLWNKFGSPAKAIEPKLGSSGGPEAGKSFSNHIKDTARAESNHTCVFCGVRTTRGAKPHSTRSNIDHAIPKSRQGNNTLNNAQNTCQSCNLRKGSLTTEEFLSKIGTGR